VVAEKTVIIDNKYGLHARPAMQFVELAAKFAADISLVRGDKVADAKSIMEILTLAAEKGSELAIRADGPDAEAAVDALWKLVASKFDEE
jgi:phosphotransferase system HPr (HPr) family protein